MKRFAIFLLFVAGISFPVRGDVVIPDVATYDPPTFFRGFKPGSGSYNDPYSWRKVVRSYRGQPNRPQEQFRELDVAVRGVGIETGEGKRYVFKKISDDELKKLLTGNAKKATNSPEVEEITISGYKALRIHRIIPMPQIHEGITFYRDLIWVRLRPHLVLELRLCGNSPEMLKTVRDSLSTFKISPNPKFPKAAMDELSIAKGVPRLGAMRPKKLGKPILSGPSDSLYYTGKYFVSIGYQMPKVVSISYMKVSDPEKFAAASRANAQAYGNTLQLLAEGDQTDKYRLSPEERRELFQPMDEKEIQEILALHAVDLDGKPLTWKPLEKNLWQRSDGAMAGYRSKRKFTIATKERSANLHGVAD